MSRAVPAVDVALAVLGTVLAWLPLAATLGLSLVGTIADRTLRFDFLMPAELFPVYLAGAVLLAIAAVRTRRWRRWLLLTPLVAIAALAGTQGLAVLTGLADGTHPPAGWRLVLVLGLLALYVAAVIVNGVAGWRLARELRRDAA
jgi:hypothetical protein